MTTSRFGLFGNLGTARVPFHECFYLDALDPLSCCDTPCKQADRYTPHFLYQHVEDTGGASIECALQQAADAGVVDLLDHSYKESLESCVSRCTQANVPTRTLLTVRDPYSYWARFYEHAWQCTNTHVHVLCAIFA